MKDFKNQIVGCIPRLRRFAVALAGNRPDGDDLLQTALERALSKQHTYSPSMQLDSWLFKITQNLWIDQKPSEKRRGIHIPVEDALTVTSGDSVKMLQNRHTAHKIFTAIGALPEDQRLVVCHVLVDGKSYKEAATILGLPQGTIMSRLYRARKTLEKAVLPQQTPTVGNTHGKN